LDSLEIAEVKRPDCFYRLVFRGEVENGRDIGNIKQEFSRLFKIDESGINEFFSGKPVVIKAQLNYETAVRYQSALRQIGILTAIDAHSNDEEPVEVSSSGGGEENPNAQNAAIVRCPKCGHVQKESAECARCGLIINKYVYSTSTARIRTPSITFYDTAKEKRQIWLLGFLTLILFLLVYHLWTKRDIRHPPGVLIKSEPLQVMIRNPKPWRIGSRIFVPLATFSLRARVLSSERYRLDAVADIAPLDLALGWGPMSDQSILDQLEIAQGNRRFVIVPKGQGPPLPWGVLLSHSSNMHMIPADEQIKKTLFSIRTGDLIHLSGYLTGIQENGQWTWFSSLSRMDTGDGACEIVWVQRIETISNEN
jgi:hypothetical protein